MSAGELTCCPHLQYNITVSLRVFKELPGLSPMSLKQQKEKLCCSPVLWPSLCVLQ